MLFVGSTVFSLLSNAAESTKSTAALLDAIIWRNVQAVEQAITNGADVNAKNNYGETPLHKAASLDSSETVELLIQKGAEVDAKDDGGATPLHRAVLWESPEVVKLLIRKGADVNAKDKHGETPLDKTVLSVSESHEHEVAKFLIQKGAKRKK
jgi:ankyrin repeat protein